MGFHLATKRSGFDVQRRRLDYERTNGVRLEPPELILETAPLTAYAHDEVGQRLALNDDDVGAALDAVIPGREGAALDINVHAELERALLAGID